MLHTTILFQSVVVHLCNLFEQFPCLLEIAAEACVSLQNLHDQVVFLVELGRLLCGNNGFSMQLIGGEDVFASGCSIRLGVVVVNHVWHIVCNYVIHS